MNVLCKSTRMQVLITLLLASVGSLVIGTPVEAKAQSRITIAQLAGPWQIALVGNTGCGASSMVFTGTLNASGTATGTLTGNSRCGRGSSTQTFTINSLNTHGSGTASLSCGSGCGWNFDIQVAPDKQTFNLVDIVNGGNGLAGTAIAQVGSAITIDQLAGPWQIALVGNTGCGASSMVFNGTLDASGTATGTLTGNSGCGPGSSTQTFTINSLNAEGSGTASLSCGSGCGWNFAIQVAPNEQTFNLVDIVNGGNGLAGTAVAKPGFAIVPDLIGDSLLEARAEVQAVGLNLRSSGVGDVVIQTPKAGTAVGVGSTVTVVLSNK